ncbi:hypothetical protein [Nioella sp. MMSF_3534]|uniref:hypothetical protein n=1 Tax=Nioella sp. MMSF_3534 TaxID=3046720 RepID=UPI00273D9609|nr:hypothetical protein [Nioella sp. MMSF_3534]
MTRSSYPAVALGCALCCAGMASANETVPTVAPPATLPVGQLVGQASLSYGFNDNVLFVADQSLFFPPGGEQAASFATLRIGAAYEWPGSGTLSFGVIGGISATRYFGDQPAGMPPGTDDPSAYSNAAVSATLFARYSPGGPGGRLEILPSYTFRHESDADVEALGLTSHQLRLDARYQASPQLRVDGHLLYQNNDFSVVFPQPTRDRDADYTEAGLGLVYTTAPGGVAFRAGIALEHNDANGSDWSYDGLRLSAGISGPLAANLFGALDVSISDSDTGMGFTDLVAGGRTDQTVTTLTGRLVYRLSETGSITATVTYHDVSANNPAFSGNSLTGAIGYAFQF